MKTTYIWEDSALYTRICNEVIFKEVVTRLEMPRVPRYLGTQAFPRHIKGKLGYITSTDLQLLLLLYLLSTIVELQTQLLAIESSISPSQ